MNADPLTIIQSRWNALQQAHRAEEDARKALRAARNATCEAIAELDRCLAGMQPGTHPIFDAAERPEPARTTGPPSGTLPAQDPHCHRCGATGGEVADLPSLADEPTNLIPADVCDIDAVLTPLGIPEKQAEDYHVCLKCYDELQPKKLKGRKSRKAKPATKPPEPEPLTPATPLNVVLPASVADRPKVLEALYAADLRTVGDVLNKVKALPPEIDAESNPWGYGGTSLAAVLRRAELSSATYFALYDSLIEGGILDLMPPLDLSAQVKLPVPPVKVPANEVPEPPRHDALTIPCPQCHAEVGAKCRNYKGQNCAPHRMRLNKGVKA